VTGRLAWRAWLAWSVTPLACGAVAAVAPLVSVPERWLDAATFGLAVLLTLVALVSASVTPLARRGAMAAASLSVVTLVLAGVSRAHGRAWAVAIDVALYTLAAQVGGAVGRKVADPGHLLAAGAVAAAADLASVQSSIGPTHAIVARPELLAVLAIAAPVPGTHAMAPAIGLGDLVFIALVLGVVQAHRLSFVRATAAAGVGLALAGAASAWLASAVPALPFIAAATIGLLPEARRVHRRDRAVTRAVVSGALVVIAYFAFRMWRAARAS
jgi:hypothetical protein